MTAAPPFEDLAREAARTFLDPSVDLHFIGRSDTITYRAESAGGRFLLRIHLPVSAPIVAAYHTREALESECSWLAALSRDTTIGVQTPVALPDGHHVLELTDTDQGSAHATVLGWVQGEHVKGRRTESQARALGTLLGRLHCHAESWVQPADFFRPTDERALSERVLPRYELLESRGVVTHAELAPLRAALAAADERVRGLDLPAGLIHCDLHESNYVQNDGRLHPIDFGRASVAPWLHDLAETMGHLGPDNRRRLLEAYVESRPHAEVSLPGLEALFIGAVLEVLAYHAPNPDEAAYIQKAVPAYRSTFERFLAGKPFLLGDEVTGR